MASVPDDQLLSTAVVHHRFKILHARNISLTEEAFQT